MTTRLFDLKAGDPVIIKGLSRLPTVVRRTVVTSVGRKWLKVGNQKFSRLTGAIGDEYGHYHAYSLSEWDEIEEVRRVRGELSRYGVTVDSHVTRKSLLTIHKAVVSAFSGKSEV
jgi:hypothetical protein